jgi:ArsR family transcriptional regulator
MNDVVRSLKALSDRSRLRVFLLLARKDLCVCEMMYVLEMPQSRISHQLRILREAGLVEDKRNGRWIIYTVPREIKRDFAPLLQKIAGRSPAGADATARDIERLGLCLREGIRKKRGAGARRAGS